MGKNFLTFIEVSQKPTIIFSNYFISSSGGGAGGEGGGGGGGLEGGGGGGGGGRGAGGGGGGGGGEICFLGFQIHICHLETLLWEVGQVCHACMPGGKQIIPPPSPTCDDDDVLGTQPPTVACKNGGSVGTCTRCTHAF